MVFINIINQKVIPTEQLRVVNRESGLLVAQKASRVLPKPYILEPLQNGPSSFVAFFVSDIHLNNHMDNHVNHLGNREMFDNPQRIHFRKWLTKNLIRDEIENAPNAQQANLILLGDTFDINASWRKDFMPLDKKGNLSDLKYSTQVLEEIVLNNSKIINELKRFLELTPYSRLLFIDGNHDHILFLDSTLQDYVRETLMPGASQEDQKKRIIFARDVDIPLLRLHAEHGHRFDPFNYSKKNSNTLGDWITIKTSVILTSITEKLNNVNLPDKIKNKIISKVKQVEYIRPPAAIPIYFEELAHYYYEKYRVSEPKAANEARNVLLSFSGELGNILSQTSPLNILPKQLLSSKRFQSFFANIFATVQDWTDSNKSQITEAKKLADKNDINFFVGGHTHSLKHMAGYFRYVNMGAWKPVINADRCGNNWVFPESILPSSVLRLATNLKSRKRKTNINYNFDTFVSSTVKISAAI